MKQLIVLLLCISNLSWATGGAPPVQIVNNGGTGTGLGCTLGANSTANNTLYVSCGQASATWTASVAIADGCGDTFAEATNSPVTGTGMRIRVYTAKTAGSCTSITLTSSVSAAFDCFCAEYNNMALSNVVDCDVGGTGNGTSLATGNCVTTTAVDTLVAIGFQALSSAIYTAGTSYTIEKQDGGTGHSGAVEDQNVTATGTYTGTMTTNTTGDWAIHVLALKNATQTTSGGNSKMLQQERYE